MQRSATVSSTFVSEHLIAKAGAEAVRVRVDAGLAQHGHKPVDALAGRAPASPVRLRPP